MEIWALTASTTYDHCPRWRAAMLLGLLGFGIASNGMWGHAVVHAADGYTVSVTTTQAGTAVPMLSAGQTRAFTASLRDPTRAPVTIGQSQFTWNVSNPRLASVSVDGVLTAKSTQVQQSVDVIASARLEGAAQAIVSGRASVAVLAAASGGAAFEFSGSAVEASTGAIRVSVGQPQTLIVRVTKGGVPFAAQPEFKWSPVASASSAVTLTDGLADAQTSVSGSKNIMGIAPGRALYRVSAPVGLGGVVIAAEVGITVSGGVAP